jgi:hypothetical protein
LTVPLKIVGADQQYLFAAFVRGAVLAGAASNPTKTPKEVLEAIVLARFKSEATNGRTLISSSESGGSTSFSAPAMLSPADVIALAERALQWLDTQTDPANPNLAGLRKVGRLRASFFNARP